MGQHHHLHRLTLPVFLAVTGFLGVYLFLVPDSAQQAALWAAVGLLSVAAVGWGTWRYRPQRWQAWLLIGAALLVFTVGEATWLAGTGVLRRQDPTPSLADAVYLGLFLPLALLGLLRLARTGVRHGDRGSLLDTLILSAGVGLLSWTFLIRPFLGLAEVPVGQRAVLMAYPVAGVLLVATLTRLGTAVRWNPSVSLLLAGGVLLFLADVRYAVWYATDSEILGGPMGIGFVALCAAWGAAALHPSMVRLTAAGTGTAGELGPRRRTVLGLAAVMSLAVLLVEAIAGSPVEIAVATVLTAVLFVLILSRLTTAAAAYRHALTRERVLREAGAALVAAADPDEVTAAVRQAVAALLPPNTPHQVAVVLASDRTGVVPYAEPAGADAARVISHHRLAAAGGPAGPRGGATDIGDLYLTVPGRWRSELTGTIEVLASLAAQALERIRLAGEINQRESEEYFRTLVQNTADVILIVTDDDTVRYASPSATTVLGAKWITGRCFTELVHPTDRESIRGRLRELRTDPARAGTVSDLAMVGPFGRRLQTEAAWRDLRADASVGGVVITLRDVTEQRRLQRELAYRAYHDALTGLANRVLFSERIQAAVDRATADRATVDRSYGGVAGVLFLDLDDFKMVNDTLGHTAGDELLVAVSNRLVGLLPEGATAARLGGDEFGALVSGAARPEQIDELARTVVEAFAEPFSVGGLAVSGAVSVGVATTAEATDPRDLLKLADLALHVAKGAGKGRWRRYQDGDHVQVLHRMEIRAGLTRALAEDAFELHYQPIVALDSGRTVGMEALIRWRDPIRGLIPPNAFVDVAEESGLIVPIGGWVIAQALADAARWSIRGDAAAPYVSVNVSARQLREPGFVAKVRDLLDEVGLDPTRLVMEITERVVIHDREPVWSDLTALRELGVRVAIDDFGTGYSSLSYLRQVPVDVVKIEKAFLQSVSTSSPQFMLLEGILGLAHRLHFEVIAEGIERPADRDLLVRLGCRYGQGFLFSPPLAPDEAIGWARESHRVGAAG